MSEEALAEDTFGHLINVELDRDTLDKKKNELVEVDKEIDKIAAAKAKAVAEYNADLKDRRAERATLLGVITSGTSQVEVLCYNERDDRRGQMLTRRKDTGEIVDERALTAEERESPDARQGNLFDGKPAPPSDLDDDEPEEQGDADTEAALEAYAAERGKVAASGVDSDGEDDSDDDDSDGEDEE